jgi:hypothetical protein
MQNTITCPHCKSENPFYKSICSQCNSFMRERIVNLDLWKTLGMLVENPSEAFKMIVFSEHKNFIIFIILFAVAKLLIDARFLSMLTLGVFQSTVGIWVSYLIILPIIFILISSLSFLFKFISKSNKIENRTKDYFALMSFIIVPYVFGLLILFPFELIIFGDYLFSLNPTPFVIKELFAYLFLALEILIILWSIFLSMKAFFVQTNNKSLSFSYAFVFNFLIGVVLYFSSKLIFTI